MAKQAGNPHRGFFMKKIPHLIKQKREQLGETQEVFGKRFGVTGTAVYLWEKGTRHAKYDVIEFCLKIPDMVICPICGGGGLVEPKETQISKGKKKFIEEGRYIVKPEDMIHEMESK